MPRDANYINVKTAILNSDGKTIKNVAAVPTTHALAVSDGAGGTDNGPSRALRDGNNFPTLLAVSSADGVTVVPLYTDSSGNLLIKST